MNDVIVYFRVVICHGILMLQILIRVGPRDLEFAIGVWYDRVGQAHYLLERQLGPSTAVISF